MKSPRLSAREWSERTILALLFLVIGGVVMIVFSPWGKQRFVDPVDNYLWRAGLSLLLVVITWLVYRSGRYEKYWQLFFALFILSVAVSLDWVFGRFLFDSLHVSDTTPAGWALPKLNELVVIGGVVILFTRLRVAAWGRSTSKKAT